VIGPAKPNTGSHLYRPRG